MTKETVYDCLSVTKQAERNGFGTIWLAEAHHYFRVGGGTWDGRSATSIAAVLGTQTKEINIGLSVINPYTRHPALLAMEIATLDEICNGRLRITLGAAKAGIAHLGYDSIQEMKPIPVFRESIQIIRELLSGNAVNFNGDIFTVDAPSLKGKSTYRSNVPLYLGATGPRLMELAGEMCDGVITASMTTPAWTRHAINLSKQGARKIRRKLEYFTVGGYLLCSVDEDGDKARKEARRMAATYLAGKVINIGETASGLLEAANVRNEELSPIVSAIKRRDETAAAETVNDDLLQRAFPVVGTPDECSKALKDFERAGMTEAVLELVGDKEEMTKSIGLLSERVLPDFE